MVLKLTPALSRRIKEEREQAVRTLSEKRNAAKLQADAEFDAALKVLRKQLRGDDENRPAP